MIGVGELIVMLCICSFTVLPALGLVLAVMRRRKRRDEPLPTDDARDGPP